jgi:hypothetical protein
MIEIFVENKQVDVSAEISALLTYSIDDVKDFAARNTTFSKTIVLPGTTRNNALFGNVFDVKNGNFHDATLTNIGYNFNPAKGAQCFIFQSNIQVFKGVIRILEILDDNGSIEYECAVFGELGGLIAKMGNKKLEDLDFSAYDHTFNASAITDSWDATQGSGIYYPLIDYGTYSTNKHDWDIRTFRPSLYVKEYLDKIFTAAGYTYDCTLFNTSRFKSAIIPYNSRKLTKYTTRALTLGNTVPYVVLDSGGFFNYIGWPDFVGSFFTQQNVNQRYMYNQTEPLTLNTVVDIDIEYRASGKNFLVSLYKNGAYVAGSSQVFVGTGGVVSANYSFTVDIPLVQNDYIEVGVLATSTLGGTEYLHLINGSLTGDNAVPIIAAIQIGDTVKMNEALPKNILQKDFLSSIIKLFNLYLTEDKYESEKIIIKPFPDFMDTNLDNAQDWSGKLNRAKVVRYKPMSEINARFYEFKYKGDSDYYNEQYQKRFNQNYGDYIYDSEYEFANEKETVDIIFSGTPLVGYTGEDKVYPTIFKRTGTGTLVEENTDSNIRIMLSKKVTGVDSWDLKDGASVLQSLTSYGYAGHFDDPDAPANDLNFGAPQELYFELVSGAINVNQFNVYWSPYMSEITDKDSRLMTAYFRLTWMDIYNLDFSKYIFVDGNLFVVNKIEDYNASMEDECKVTLLKVIDSNATVTAPADEQKDEVYIYTGAGPHLGAALYVPELSGKYINLVFKGDKRLVPTTGYPTVDEYAYNSALGLFSFGNDIETDQVIQILYKTAP